MGDQKKVPLLFGRVAMALLSIGGENRAWKNTTPPWRPQSVEAPAPVAALRRVPPYPSVRLRVRREASIRTIMKIERAKKDGTLLRAAERRRMQKPRPSSVRFRKRSRGGRLPVSSSRGPPRPAASLRARPCAGAPARTPSRSLREPCVLDAKIRHVLEALGRGSSSVRTSDRPPGMSPDLRSNPAPEIATRTTPPPGWTGING
ncbi:hypothetical protein ACHAWF_011467 [Thalassiosira exigua]